jgi:hypothetical protein
MFFCGKCASSNNWPESISKSYGPCECCDTVGLCSDVPSKYLPMPKKNKSELDVDSIT